MASSGELPTDEVGIEAKFSDWQESIVAPVGKL